METKELSQLDRIERNSLLASKSVLTFDDVKLLTGLSGSYLYKLTAGRKVPHYRPNGKILYFDKCEIEQWMKQGKVKTVDELETDAATYVATGKHSRKGAAV